MNRPNEAENRPLCHAYWEAVSENYAREIHSVFDHDGQELVKERIETAGRSSPKGRSADLGCGIGNFTPLLANAFASVEACDWSNNALKRAELNCASLGNTNFLNLDLASDLIPFAPVDFAICINVLIMPALDDRMRAWRAVTNQVKDGGTLLLVVPSHESTLMEYHHGIEERLDHGDTCQEATEAYSPGPETIEDLQQGIFSCDGTRMKYYLKEELIMLLNGREMDVTEVEMIRYPGQEGRLQQESWDWLVMARRRPTKEKLTTERSI